MVNSAKISLKVSREQLKCSNLLCLLFFASRYNVRLFQLYYKCVSLTKLLSTNLKTNKEITANRSLMSIDCYYKKSKVADVFSPVSSTRAVAVISVPLNVRLTKTFFLCISKSSGKLEISTLNFPKQSQKASVY